MFLTIFCICYVFLFAGMAIYYAFNRLGKVETAASVSVKPKTKAEEWAEEVRRRERIIQQVKGGCLNRWTSDDVGYVMWLSEHEGGVRLATPDEQHAERLRQIEEDRVKKEDKRLYEWWLYKHSDEYEKDTARLEAYLNR